jgi:hypothetical protein
MSIFNPYILLAVVLAVVGSFGGGYYKGSNDEVTRQQLEIAALNAAARQKEQALVNAVTTQATKLQKANQDAKLIAKERDAAIASGALKLRIPIQSPVCPVQTTGDTPAPAGDSVQATAEFDRQTAQSLVAITDQGDANTRQLNACIDAYNAIYQTLRSK